MDQGPAQAYAAAKRKIPVEAARVGFQVVHAMDLDVAPASGWSQAASSLFGHTLSPDHEQLFELTRAGRALLYRQPYLGSSYLPGTFETFVEGEVPDTITLRAPFIRTRRNKLLLLLAATLALPLTPILLPLCILFLVCFNRPRWTGGRRARSLLGRLRGSRTMSIVLQRMEFIHSVGGVDLTLPWTVQLRPFSSYSTEIVFRAAWRRDRGDYGFTTMRHLADELALLLPSDTEPNERVA